MHAENPVDYSNGRLRLVYVSNLLNWIIAKLRMYQIELIMQIKNGDG